MTLEDPTAGGSSSRRPLVAHWLGRVPYARAERLQAQLRDGVIAGSGVETLLLLEHPPVVTAGRNADPEQAAGSLGVPQRPVEVAESDRGGQLTFHGPGQLVGYPILDLKPDRRDIRRYVKDLEEVMIRTVRGLGVEAEHSDGDRPIGVWVGPKKIGSIGVHLRRWVTTHGFALNLTTDLSYFSSFAPCGLDSGVIASVESLTGRAVSVESVASTCARHFAEVFERDDFSFAVLDETAVGATASVAPGGRAEGAVR